MCTSKAFIFSVMSFTILFGMTCWAGNEQVKPEQKDWNDYIGQADTNIGMKERADEAKTSLNRRMAKIIQKLRSHLDSEQKDLFTKAQKAWREKTKAECSLVASRFRGGTHEGLEYRVAHINEIKFRINELLNLVKLF